MKIARLDCGTCDIPLTAWSVELRVTGATEKVLLVCEACRRAIEVKVASVRPLEYEEKGA